MKKEQNKNNVQQYAKFAIVILMIAIFAVLANVFVRKALNNKSDVNDDYQYEITKNSDYQVILKENNFIIPNIQTPGQLYISRLVDSIKSNLSYKYSANEISNLKYSYSVVATITASYQSVSDADTSGNNVWTKKYTLVNPTTKTVNNVSSITINEPVNIDFLFYENKIREFIEQLSLNVDAFVRIDMTVDLSGKSKTGDVVSKSDIVSLLVPLGKDVFKVKNDQNVVSSDIVTSGDGFSFTIDYPYLIAGIVCLVISVVFTVMLGSEILKRSHKSKYHTELHKILHDYGEIVVEVLNPISTKGKKVMMVKNFNEMVDLEQELRIPILCYSNEILGRTVFSIVASDTVYLYNLDS